VLHIYIYIYIYIYDVSNLRVKLVVHHVTSRLEKVNPAVLVGVSNSLMSADQDQANVKHFYAAMINSGLFLQIDILLFGFY
jgi:hypothetical protein